ncbi:MAG: TauD/TfdA family dioxygenase [Myxococcota bacterium]
MIDIAELRPGPCKFLDVRRAELAALPFERISLRALSPTIGAEIGGVDLTQPIDDATFAEVERAFLAHKVVFFRGQPISAQQQLAFAQRFGALDEHPFLPAKDGRPDVVRFEKSEVTAGVENIWHSDVSWRELPPLGSMLHAIDVPEVGGDTLWADMEAAYEGLSDEVRERIEGLEAVHDFANTFGRALSPEKLAENRRRFPPVAHPVVRTHPVTGRRSIYVNAIFTSHIVGLEPEQSDALLRLLCAQAHVPEYQCRFRWEGDSVALWDNRSAQHYAASDYWPRRRVMERVAIIGDRPF